MGLPKGFLLPRLPLLSKAKVFGNGSGLCVLSLQFKLESNMNSIIYIIGLVVVVLIILSFLGLA